MSRKLRSLIIISACAVVIVLLINLLFHHIIRSSPGNGQGLNVYIISFTHLGLAISFGLTLLGMYKKNPYYYIWAVIIGVIFFDQGLKILIKTNMTLGAIPVFGKWFYINFTENAGMAFGVDLPSKFGKPLLTIFRLVAAFFIAWYLRSLVRKEAPLGFIICLAFIFVGAIGNIFDSLFYGVIFNDSYQNVATMFPEGGGDGKVLYGKVVDMFYFPIIKGQFPSWFPFWGGQSFTFFNAIFNVADAAISVGVACILLFQRKYLKRFD